MLKVLPLLLFLLICTNCNIEDVTLEEPSENNKEIETVSIDEALGLFKKGSTMRSTFSKSKSIYDDIELDFDRIKQETITNSEELLTIIPVNTPYKDVNSRVLLLKINGELKSVAFNMIRTKTEEDKKFTGDVIITDLEANFLHGYKVNKGTIMSMLIKSASSKASKDVSLKSLRLMNKADPEDGSDCIYSDPSWCNLDEVIIYAYNHNPSFVPVSGVYFGGSSAIGTTTDSSGYSWSYNNPPEEEKTWYLDNDGDGYHSLTKLAATQTSSFWKSSTQGIDCDDGDWSKTTNCEENNCTKHTGFLHDANFTNKTPILGNNTTISEDNFRNDSWGIISETNCGNGRIPKNSTVNVTSTTPTIRTLANGAKLSYYKVEYEDCPKGNNSNSGTVDKNKPCSDCFKGNPTKGDMNLAKQKASGYNGATKGLTRKKSVGGKLVPKEHKGVDIETKVGDPIYAMFDGTARLKTNTKNGKVVGGGYYVALVSTVNGQRVETWYFHMAKDTRVSGEVKAGDIIGHQGLSGNLKKAVKKGTTPVHVHIQLYENYELKDPLPYLKAGLNKTTGKFTNESDCNN